MEDFPGNSYTSRTVKQENEQEPEKSETASEPKKVAKVIGGNAIGRKKPLGERMKDMFISDGGSFAEHLAENVIVPMVKDIAITIIAQTAEGFKQGFEEMLFGSDKSRPRRTTSYGTGRPVVNYNKVTSRTSMTRQNSVRPESRAVRRSNSIKDIIVESREDGDLVIEELDAMIDRIGHCTVGDFYSLVGESTRSTDEEWGWTDLSGARVTKIATDEYLVSMPRPRPVDS